MCPQESQFPSSVQVVEHGTPTFPFCSGPGDVQTPVRRRLQQQFQPSLSPLSMCDILVFFIIFTLALLCICICMSLL